MGIEVQAQTCQPTPNASPPPGNGFRLLGAGDVSVGPAAGYHGADHMYQGAATAVCGISFFIAGGCSVWGMDALFGHGAT